MQPNYFGKFNADMIARVRDKKGQEICDREKIIPFIASTWGSRWIDLCFLNAHFTLNLVKIESYTEMIGRPPHLSDPEMEVR